ncbi:hypothetical protein FCM35_KLT14499 [Carex littledalei]|uniref:DUF547 domain-containing protein n=1 Tax=Carex littledalei TaxID=544730 RepID=A0A833QJT4_9POAL|nr:hypothetical protein FCM35_KLT14499 [Carex littledalei]
MVSIEHHSASDGFQSFTKYESPYHAKNNWNQSQAKRLQFELHQERSIHAMLEKTIGRASTASSPGHANFSAQIKELMVEIDLLEEEIANREQHVLSLYRSIFDQCISTAPSSERGSSIASPVRSIKERPKKHPIVVSSAFCSSKKFNFRSFQIWGALSKQKFISKPDIRQEGPISSEPKGIHLTSISSDVSTVLVLRSSNSGTCLKEDLSKCPNKVSEEMVRYMATIYCLLQWTDPSEKAEKMCAPFLSRSSTTALPRRSNGSKDRFSSKRPFEMCSIWSEKYQSSDASSAINNYRLLLKQLERVNPGRIAQNAKCAFWLNIYNSLVMHAYLTYGFPSSSLRRMLLIHKAAYNIGGYTVTASSIEHYILHCHTPGTGRWIETMFINAMRKKNGEEKHLTNSCYALAECEPLVLFALCTGSSSDPMLRVYTPENLSDELKKARKEYLEGNVEIKNSKRVVLPKVIERYAKEASLSHNGVLKLVWSSLEGKYPDFVENLSDLTGSRKRASQIIEWLPHNARFHYVFARNLTQKPCLR